MTMAMTKIIKDAANRYRNRADDGQIIISMMYDTVIDLAQTARIYGLLALEEKVAEFAKGESGAQINTLDEFFYKDLSGTDRLLAVLTMCVVDAMDPELVEQIAIERYYASDFQGSEAIAACMVIIGILGIQQGENPKVISQKLLALLPDEMENMLIEAVLEERKAAGDNVRIPDSFFEKKEEGASEIIRTLNGVIGVFNDPEIQLILRNTENDVLCSCLEAMSGDARKNIFNNVSARLAGSLYTAVEQCQDQQAQAEEAAAQMLELILELEDSGEVVLNGSAYPVNAVKAVLERRE